MRTKIYTKTGDTGETSLLGGTRVSKADSRLDAYGTIDELNSVLGMAIYSFPNAKPDYKTLIHTLTTIQNELFIIGSHLACDDKKMAKQLPQLSTQFVSHLESEIDKMGESLPELKNFVLPGGSQSAATLHFARTVCRRAERHTIRLLNHDKACEIKSTIVITLNRLSDYLFVAARYVNWLQKQNETIWSPHGVL